MRHCLPVRLGGVFVTAALIVLPGCGNTASEAPAATLSVLPEGSAWALAGSDVPGLGVDAAARITLQVADGRLAGNSGCNGFSAAYTLQGGRLALGPVMATKRGCLGPEAEVERALFGALPLLREARMAGDALVLRGEGGIELRFAPAPPASP